MSVCRRLIRRSPTATRTWDLEPMTPPAPPTCSGRVEKFCGRMSREQKARGTA